MHSSMPMSPALGSLELDTAFPQCLCLTRAEQMWRITVPDLLELLCLMQPRRLLVFFCFESTLLAHSQLVVQYPHVHSYTAAFPHPSAAPSLYWFLGLFFPSCGTSHSILSNLMKSLFSHFSSLLRSLWMVVQPSGVSATPPNFVLPADLVSLSHHPGR